MSAPITRMAMRSRPLAVSSAAPCATATSEMSARAASSS